MTPRQILFLVLAAACLLPGVAAPVALGVGVVVALLGLAAFEKPAKQFSRLIIQCAIVLLGFSIDLHQVVQAGTSGLAFAAGTIVLTFGLGWLLGRSLGTDPKVSTLLCAGTAICGGSAIAATGAVIRASDAQMSVALAAVFVLNAIALYLFPPIGHALELSQAQFGAWAAVAIHDMSSVVAAGKVYGDEALQQATVIKLARVLWIVPVSLLAGWILARQAADPATPATPAGAAAPPPRTLLARVGTIIPWFIALFVLASVIRTYAGVPAGLADGLKAAAKQGMVLALFLIGSGLSRRALTQVGWRPFAQAAVLWLVVSVVALLVIRRVV